jgi:hypothetical protein
MYYLQRFLAFIGINAWWLGAPHKPASFRMRQYQRLWSQLVKLRHQPRTPAGDRQIAAIKRKMNSMYGKL